jgi:hypothetical protein
MIEPSGGGWPNANRAAWLVLFPLATLVPSYVGEFDPLKELGFPVSTLIEPVVARIAYLWGSL